MATYLCSRCDQFKDTHGSVCTEDPRVENGLMCESCAAEVGDTPEVRQGGVFTADQQAFIKKMEAESDEWGDL